jgi:hypothetical protein
MLRRRVAATLALSGMLLPWASSAGVALHLLAGHDFAAPIPSSHRLDAPLHGHHHEEGTPPHAHGIAAPQTVSAEARSIQAPRGWVQAFPRSAKESPLSPAPFANAQRLPGPGPPVETPTLLRI